MRGEDAFRTGGKQGMKLLNDTLCDLVEKKIVAPEKAFLKAVGKDDLIGRFGRGGVRINTAFDAPASPAGAPAALPKAGDPFEQFRRNRRR